MHRILPAVTQIFVAPNFLPKLSPLICFWFSQASTWPPLLITDSATNSAFAPSLAQVSLACTCANHEEVLQKKIYTDIKVLENSGYNIWWSHVHQLVSIFCEPFLLCFLANLKFLRNFGSTCNHKR